MPGRLITLEGVDGVGKSTMLILLAQRLKEEGYSVLCTKEPGSPADETKLGLELRNIMFQTVTTHNMAPGVVDCLLLADHMQHVEKVIKPGLAEGKTIISDRYADSEFCYGSIRGTPSILLEAYNTFFGPIPDITVLFVAEDVDAILQRARSRVTETHQTAKKWNDPEQQKIIQQEYLRRLVGQQRTILLTIKADKTPEQVFNQDLWPSVKFAIDNERFRNEQ